MSPEPSIHGRDSGEKRLEVGTWGVFFVWLGVSFLARLPWGVWLLGVGLIILGAQVARRALGLRLEVFWLVAGVLFVLGAVSEIAPLGLDIAVIPALCIAAGIGLLAKALARRREQPHG